MKAVIFTKNPEKKFQDYSVRSFTPQQIDKKYGIFYDDVDFQKEVEDYNVPRCPICSTVTTTVPLLQSHVKTFHGKEYWFV